MRSGATVTVACRSGVQRSVAVLPFANKRADDLSKKALAVLGIGHAFMQDRKKSRFAPLMLLGELRAEEIARVPRRASGLLRYLETDKE